MKKIMKKVVALAALAAVVCTTVVGCASGSNVDNSEVVATVGETEITAGVANFYLRYQQSSVESLYEMYIGQDYWSATTSEGNTYAEGLKETTLSTLHEFYVLDAHAEEYGVTLTEEELAKIQTAAEQFVAANSDKVNENISGDVEVVAEVLRLFTVNEKMFQAMTADVDRDVTPAEAAQKRLRYHSLKKTTTVDGATETLSDEELAKVKKEAEDFLAGAKANGSMEAYSEETEISTYTLSFDSESETIAAEVIAAADKLAVGEFAEVIDTEYFYYVVQLESDFDEEATAAEIENIITERESEAYAEVASGWLDAMPIEVNEEAWANISVEDLKVIDATVSEEE